MAVRAAKALISGAIAALHDAAEANRLPLRWRISQAAAMVLLNSRDYYVAKFARDINRSPAMFFGLPAEIVEGDTGITLVLADEDI